MLVGFSVAEEGWSSGGICVGGAKAAGLCVCVCIAAVGAGTDSCGIFSSWVRRKGCLHHTAAAAAAAA